MNEIKSNHSSNSLFHSAVKLTQLGHQFFLIRVVELFINLESHPVPRNFKMLPNFRLKLKNKTNLCRKETAAKDEQDELTFDHFHKKCEVDSIAEVTFSVKLYTGY